MRYKICHVTSVHNSSDVRIFEKECASLAKNQNYDVYLVAKGDSYNKKGVSIIGLGESPASRIKRVLIFAHKIVKKAIQLDADIYHLHDPELLLYVPLLKLKKKIVIFDSHEDVADSILDKTYLPYYARKPISILYSLLSNRMMRKCDALISVTPHIVDKLRKVNSNTYMITNYPFVTDSIPKSSDFNTKKIIFAGGITPQWSHELVINAISKTSDGVYELYGPADEDYLEKLKLLDGWKRTHYHGKVSFEEVNYALNKADVAVALLKPSNNTCGMYGTIGNTKLFESMSAGLPVICTDFKLWKEIVDGNHCGICIDVNSIDELTTAIQKLFEQPQLSTIMGKNGKKAVEKTYNWLTQEIILFELYDNVLNNH